MEKAINPRRINTFHPIYNNPTKRMCGFCGSIIDYISHNWWKCRQCGRWTER